MKKSRIITILLLSISMYIRAQEFTRSTYLVGHQLNSIEYIKQIDFSRFDYIYLMAAPDWKNADFGQPVEKIRQQLVSSHQYIEDKNTPVVPYLIHEAHKYGTKVLLSFAGEGFREKVENPETRHKFIRFMTAFIKKYDYDGIEIDWESDLSLPLHADFIKELRIALHALEKETKKKLYLTTALHSWQKYSRPLADRLSSSVDWLNIMTYDMGGGIWGNVAGHNTPLDQIEREMKNWDVFDRNRLCIGLANYGFIYHNITPGQKVEGKLNRYGSYISYNKMMPLLRQGWTEEYDTTAKVSYFYSPDKKSFITMDTPQSIRTKIDWIKQNRYKGIFWWEFSYDTIPPVKTGDKIKHHLIDIVK